MPPPPLALPPAFSSELITFILTHQTYPTTLIICQSRANFLLSLRDSTSTSHNREPSFPPNDTTSSEKPSTPPPPEPPRRHPLLTPTLHQLATSRHISLVFIPTLSHLRAYLSVFPPSPQNEKIIGGPQEQQKFDKSGKKGPLVVVYGLVELHRDTSEWSAQGLGHSVSVLVEAGVRSGRAVMVIEERKLDYEIEGEQEGVDDEEVGDYEAAVEARNWKRMCKVWEQRVPMLNGSMRRAGIEGEDGGWSGRTVAVGRILGRWVKFGRADWAN
ncbi:hypothetical protein G7Y89_g7878 [Cudoniella acicularis]|uniref:Uncharacterized protein n=1 Tax=Cudoniella acicularis TaxID=354080 RepID=A0A8H4RHN8_9HELO|nr:hypothetical protein G7Y89_g7878 [Cudoniella acicularis]